MVLEVASLYFIEANIFRGVSQLSRKTQLCVMLGRDRGTEFGFLGLVFFVKMYKKQGIQLHKRLEQGVFLVQKQLKADARVDLPTSRAQFFLRARGFSGRFFMFLRQKRAREKRRTLRKSSLRVADQAVSQEPILIMPIQKPPSSYSLFILKFVYVSSQISYAIP